MRSYYENTPNRLRKPPQIGTSKTYACFILDLKMKFISKPREIFIRMTKQEDNNLPGSIQTYRERFMLLFLGEEIYVIQSSSPFSGDHTVGTKCL